MNELARLNKTYDLKASPARPVGLKPGPAGLVFSLHSTDGATTFLYIANITQCFIVASCVKLCLFNIINIGVFRLSS